MKLFIEKNPELVRLNYQFKKIEALADKLGIDLNDFCMDVEDSNNPELADKETDIAFLKSHRIRLYSENSKGEKSNTVSSNNVKLFVSK